MDHAQLKAGILHQYHSWRQWVPKRLLYHPDHFKVRALLAAAPEVQALYAEQRLRRILRNATAHVPYYRSKVKIDPDDIDHAPLPELIARFPYIGKAEVMERQQDFRDRRFDPAFLLYVTSHGSTGTGIGVWRSKREADIEKAFYASQWGRLGFDFDKSRYLRIGYDAVRPLDAAPVWQQGNRLMLSPDHLRPANLSVIVDAIERFRPQFIHAYPSTALALVQLLDDDRRELGIPLRGVLLGSEPASPGQLALLSRVFRAPVSISYGLTERTNLAFACHDSSAVGAYRFQPLYAWNENRMQHGRPEIVGTSLWNEAMPLIRYCTGDFGLIDGDGYCQRIEGRLQEFVVDRHGNRLPGLTIVLDACSWQSVKACQLYQRERGKVTLRVVPRHSSLRMEERSALLAGPVRHWGSAIEFDYVEVPEIAAGPGGKRCFVISDMPSTGG